MKISQETYIAGIAERFPAFFVVKTEPSDQANSYLEEVILSEEKWNLERVHKEVYEARTKLFVITKVLETGSIKIEDFPEWMVVIKPLLRELISNAEKIGQAIDPDGKY